jgi:hypothetical protein
VDRHPHSPEPPLTLNVGLDESNSGDFERFILLAQGNPPMPVPPPPPSGNHRGSNGDNRNNDNHDDGDGDENDNIPRKERPRTGPKTPEGKNRSKMNARTHGLRTDFRHLPMLPGEDQALFIDIQKDMLLELEPWDRTSQAIVDFMARALWDMHRADDRFPDAVANDGRPYVDTALLFDRYKTSAGRRFEKLQKQLREMRAEREKRLEKKEKEKEEEANKPPPPLRDGKPYELKRIYIINKFSNNPSPRHQRINFALERVEMSDGSHFFGRHIALTEFMGGEFMKLGWGVGKPFREKLKEWSKTNKMFQPGEPVRTPHWPPPVPDDCPPDEWFMDEEMSLAPEPLVLLAERQRLHFAEVMEDEFRKMEEESRARQKEEREQQEQEDEESGEPEEDGTGKSEDRSQESED